jgi:hypothetical protein
MKSVPNLISYLQEFSWNFSQLLAICFELFSFGSIFNSKNHCRGVPPVSLSLSPRRARLSACRFRVAITRPCPRHEGAGRQCRGLSRRCPDSPIAASPLASPIAVSDATVAPLLIARVRARHAAFAFAAFAPVSVSQHRVFTSSLPRSPLFRRRLCHLTSPPSSCVGHR